MQGTSSSCRLLTFPNPTEFVSLTFSVAPVKKPFSEEAKQNLVRMKNEILTQHAVTNRTDTTVNPRLYTLWILGRRGPVEASFHPARTIDQQAAKN